MLYQSIEYLAGGKFMAQHSGYEQTNGKGMNTMQNFEKVSNKVAAMRAPGDSELSPPTLRELEMHAWLKVEFEKCRRINYFYFL